MHTAIMPLADSPCRFALLQRNKLSGLKTSFFARSLLASTIIHAAKMLLYSYSPIVYLGIENLLLLLSA